MNMRYAYYLPNLAIVVVEYGAPIALDENEPLNRGLLRRENTDTWQDLRDGILEVLILSGSNIFQDRKTLIRANVGDL